MLGRLMSFEDTEIQTMLGACQKLEYCSLVAAIDTKPKPT
jgi:hypothetical protein